MNLLSYVQSKPGLTLEGNSKLRCPFHDEKTPSLNIYTDTEEGSFYCFGCGEGGDAIHFIQLYEDIDFIQAAKIVGREIVAGTKEPIKPKIDYDQLVKDQLKTQDRSILAKKLGAYGLSEDFAEQNGIYWCDSTNRLQFPLVDPLKLKIKGIAGRHDPEDESPSIDTPKWLYSKGFDKNKTMHTLSTFKKVLAENPTEIFIVEGPGDVAALLQMGHPAVCPGGSSISTNQALMLYCFHPKTIFSIWGDPDSAGAKFNEMCTRALVSVKNDKRLITRVVIEELDPRDSVMCSSSKKLITKTIDSYIFMSYILYQRYVPPDEESNLAANVGFITAIESFLEEANMTTFVFTSTRRALANPLNNKFALSGHMSGYAAKIFAQLRENPLESRPLHTGFPLLDQVVRMETGSFNIVGALTSVGKTTFLINLLVNSSILPYLYTGKEFARNNEVSLFIALESRVENIAENVQLTVSGTLDLNREKLLPAYRTMTEASEMLVEQQDQQRNMILTDHLSSISDIIAYIKQIKKAEPELKTVYIDHIHLVTIAQGQHHSDYVPAAGSTLALAHISGELRRIATLLDIRVIAAAQFGRSATVDYKKEYTIPGLQDFRNSSSIEQDVNAALILSSPETFYRHKLETLKCLTQTEAIRSQLDLALKQYQKYKGTVNLAIAKNRTGRADKTIVYNVNRECALFEERCFSEDF